MSKIIHCNASTKLPNVFVNVFASFERNLDRMLEICGIFVTRLCLFPKYKYMSFFSQSKCCTYV